MRRLLLLLIVLGLILLVAPKVNIGLPFVDKDGYWRNPTLLDLFAPPVGASYRASIIKSRQEGSCTINSGSTTCTATITAVTVANTLIIDNGENSAYTSGNENERSTKVLTNATTVTGTCDDTSSSPNCTPTFTALEFYGSVFTANAIQRGVISIGSSSTSATATVTATTGSNPTVQPCGSSGNNHGSVQREMLITVVRTNSTTVTATRNTAPGGGSAVVGCYQVLDWR